MTVLALKDADTLDRREHAGVDAPGEAELDGARGFAPQALHRVGDEEPPILDDGDAVDDALHFVELVGGQEHGPPFGDRLAHESRELVLHQRIEAGGGLVEDQQFRPVHEGQHDADLLPVAFGERAHGAVQDDVEPFDEVVEEGAVAHAAHAGCELDVRAARQALVQRQLPGQVADPFADGHARRCTGS